MRDVLVVVGVALGVVVLGLAAVLGIARSNPPAPSVATQPPATIVATVQAQLRATVSAVTPTATSAPARFIGRSPKVGGNGWIYAERTSGGVAEQVPVSGSPSDSIALWKSVNANDTVGVQELTHTGRLVGISVGTRVLVIDSLTSTIDLLEVRFIDGEWPTTTGWLQSGWVVSGLPPGFAPPPRSTSVSR